MEIKIDKKLIKKNIDKFIKKNLYLLSSDNEYIVNCHLKPRLIQSAVEKSCGIYKKIKGSENNDYEKIFSFGMQYALKIIKGKKRLSK